MTQLSSICSTNDSFRRCFVLPYEVVKEQKIVKTRPLGSRHSPSLKMVETTGVEPVASCLQSRRSTN